MRRWAAPCLDVDAGQRKLVDEMGVHGVLAGLLLLLLLFFPSADGLFDVELKES